MKKFKKVLIIGIILLIILNLFLFCMIIGKNMRSIAKDTTGENQEELIEDTNEVDYAIDEITSDEKSDFENNSNETTATEIPNNYNAKETTQETNHSATNSKSSSSNPAQPVSPVVSSSVATTYAQSSTPTSTISPTTSTNTIKRISQTELDDEKTKYLNDIKSIKPGFNYVCSKRGHVFWPYRTNEISIGVGNMNFGTIYYYVETFVEGNQEKFKYYIDWSGN